MKLLLTGGLGFIGWSFIKKFSHNYDLVILTSSKSIEKIKKFPKLKEFTIEKVSIEDNKVIDIIKKYDPEVVVHLAALSGLTKCENNPDDAFRFNVYGTHNVLKGCIECSSKMIFLSSREVYGKTLHNVSKEEDPLLPSNTYGITKMIGETLVKYASDKHNLDYTILRPTNVYGPGSDAGINMMIKSAVKENKIRVNGANRLLNLIYVEDVCDLIHTLINDNRSSKQIFNVGSTDTLSLGELAEKITRLFKKDTKIEYFSQIETESNFNPSLEKLHSFGYRPKTSLDNGIKKTIEWYDSPTKTI